MILVVGVLCTFAEAHEAILIEKLVDTFKKKCLKEAETSLGDARGHSLALLMA